jgi:hypothetical protein
VVVKQGGTEIDKPFQKSVSDLGSLTKTPWTYWHYTFTESGNYTIEARVYGVFNPPSDGLISVVGLDDVRLMKGEQVAAANLGTPGPGYNYPGQPIFQTFASEKNGVPSSAELDTFWNGATSPAPTVEIRKVTADFGTGGATLGDTVASGTLTTPAGSTLDRVNFVSTGSLVATEKYALIVNDSGGWNTLGSDTYAGGWSGYIIGGAAVNAFNGHDFIFAVYVRPEQALAPSVTQQPASQSITYGQAAEFTALASGTPTPSVQWQVRTDQGSSWTDIDGATNTTLTLTKPMVSDSANQYHAVFTNTAGSATSNAATLTVSKATATVELSNLSQTYDGSPKPVTVTTDPPGLSANVTYNDSATVPSDVGSYTVVATVNDANYQGSTQGTLVINPASDTAPTVDLNQVVPAQDAHLVSPTTTVTASFDEQVQGVTRGTFKLELRTGVNRKGVEQFKKVSATVTPSPDGMTAVLDPTKDLQSGTYQVTITGGVTDMAGNPLANAPVSWRFTVGS